MIFYSDKNVYEAALERFRYIFREFYGKRKIVVTMSGGKDSTVVLNLAHEVMKEMGIEKIPVLFLDQEAETPMTIEYIRYIMHLPPGKDTISVSVTRGNRIICSKFVTLSS